MRNITWSKSGKHMLIVTALYFIIMIVMSMVEGWMIVQEIMDVKTALSVQAICSAVISFVGGLIVAEKAGHGRLIISALTGVAIIGTLILISLIIEQRMRLDIVRLTVLFIAACAGGLVAGRKRTRR